MNQENNHIIFAVTNEGQTISKQAIPHLFDRFYKLNASDNSNGLGLAITKSIIDLHHGKICVSSDSENGTTFKILFPHILFYLIEKQAVLKMTLPVFRLLLNIFLLLYLLRYKLLRAH